MPELDIEGLSHQRALWMDETSDLEIAMVGPYGCGKTFGLAVKQALLRIANKGTDGMLVVPSYTIARRTHFRDWPAVWEKLGLKVVHEKANHAWRWPWGDRTWIGSADNPASLVGPNLGDVTFDEPGLMSLEAYERASVRARHALARVRQVVFGGTPEGINFFADMFDMPEGKRRTIWARAWHRAYAHYPAKLFQAFGHDESLLASYAEGRFVPLRVGRAWKFYDPAIHGKVEPVYDPEVPLVLACDFNVDAMRWEIGQFLSREIRWLDEIALGRDGSTERAAKEFMGRRWGKHRAALVVTGDRSGNSRSTSGPTDYRIIREELRKGPFFSVAFRVPSANPLVKHRVDNTNYHLAGRGHRVLVSTNCVELKKDWGRCAWKKGSYSVPELDKSDEERTHAGEAADYATWVLAHVQIVGGSSRRGKSSTAGLPLVA